MTDKAAIDGAVRRWIVEATLGGGSIIKHMEGIGRTWVEINSKKFTDTNEYRVEDVLNEMLNRDFIDRVPVDNSPTRVYFQVLENGTAYARKVREPRKSWR